MEKTLWQAIKDRRSYYGFTSEKPVSEDRIEQLVRDALALVPAAFNSPSTRIVLLFGEHHQKLWELTLAQLKKVTPADQFDKTIQKVNGSFASGYGTVLFFEDDAVVQGLMDGFPLYAHNFPVWSQHTNAMHQFVIWTALDAEGLGASLQHYNPLIDEDIQNQWGVDPKWKLVAQMPFGKPAEAREPKEPVDVDSTIKVFK